MSLRSDGEVMIDLSDLDKEARRHLDNAAPFQSLEPVVASFGRAVARATAQELLGAAYKVRCSMAEEHEYAEAAGAVRARAAIRRRAAKLGLDGREGG